MKAILPPAIAVTLCTALTVISSRLSGVDNETLKTIALVTFTVSGGTALIVATLVALVNRKNSKAT